MGCKVPSAEPEAPPVCHHPCSVLGADGKAPGLTFSSCVPDGRFLSPAALGKHSPGAGGEAGSCSKGVPAASWPGVLQSFSGSLGVGGVPEGREESLCAPGQAGRCSLWSLAIPGRGAGGSCITGAGQGMLFPREKNRYFQEFPPHTGNLMGFAMQESKGKSSVTN